MWKSIRQSLAEYILSLGRWGWAVAVGIILAITGGYLDISGKASFPTWAWQILLVMLLILVPFIVFHKLRINRDELQAELDTRVKRKNIADKLGEFYLSGLKLRQTLEKENFGDEVVDKRKEWSLSVIDFFRGSPELGESRVIGFMPDNVEIFEYTFGVEADEKGKLEYALLSFQTVYLKKLVEEFLR